MKSSPFSAANQVAKSVALVSWIVIIGAIVGGAFYMVKIGQLTIGIVISAGGAMLGLLGLAAAQVVNLLLINSATKKADSSLLPHEKEDQLPLPKDRHGCLATVLIIGIVGSTIFLVMFLLFPDVIGKLLTNKFDSDIQGVLLLYNVLLSLVCYLALWKWMKWGFYGICIISLISAVFNIYFKVPPVQVILGTGIGVAALYGILHIGKPANGWDQLE